MNDRDPEREPRGPSDVPSFGRVGGIDDPVPRAEYGDDREAIRERAAPDAATRTPDGQPTNVVLYYMGWRKALMPTTLVVGLGSARS